MATATAPPATPPAVYTPVAGTGPGATLRFSRGYVVTGVTHAVRGEGIRPGGGPVQAVCGRQVVVYEVYATDAWARMTARPDLGICGRCVERAR